MTAEDDNALNIVQNVVAMFQRAQKVCRLGTRA